MSSPMMAFTLKASGITPVIKTPVKIHAVDKDGNNKVSEVIAIWDTGATKTCISYKLAKALNIIPLGFAKAHTAAGIARMEEYSIRVELPGSIICSSIRCGSFPGSGDVHVLIGMDIITTGDLSITNAGGKTYVSFRIPPDYRHIDYHAAQEKGKNGKLMSEHIRKQQK